MLYDLVCQLSSCGIAFRNRNKRQKYCCDACARRARTVKTPEEIRAYLLRHVSQSDSPDVCWLWQGYVNPKSGYGQASVAGEQLQAHRVSYTAFVQFIPQDMHVLHVRHCPHRHCINPRHLYLGTEQQNAEDRMAVGRVSHGSSHCHTDFLEKDVEAILVDYHERHRSMKSIAKQRNRTRETIRSIIQRKTWQHVLPGQYPYVKPEGLFPGFDVVASHSLVREIRRLYDSGVHLAEITRIIRKAPYQVTMTRQNVRFIAKRVTWKDVR